MANDLKAVGGVVGTAFCGLGTAVGGVLTVATLGQAEWTKDMTRSYANGTKNCAQFTADSACNSVVGGAVETSADAVGLVAGSAATVVTLGQVQATIDITAFAAKEIGKDLRKTVGRAGDIIEVNPVHRPGDMVEVFSNSQKCWKPDCEVVEVRKDGSIHVRYKDGSGNKHILAEWVGTRVRSQQGVVGAMLDKVPVVGHVKGVIHVIRGDEAEYVRAHAAATRTCAAVGGGAVGFAGAGPAGALSGGMLGGAAFDHLHTSLSEGGYHDPKGHLAPLFKMFDSIENKETAAAAGHFFAFAMLMGEDAAWGKFGGKIISTLQTQNAMTAEMAAGRNGVAEAGGNGEWVSRERPGGAKIYANTSAINAEEGMAFLEDKYPEVMSKQKKFICVGVHGSSTSSTGTIWKQGCQFDAGNAQLWKETLKPPGFEVLDVGNAVDRARALQLGNDPNAVGFLMQCHGSSHHLASGVIRFGTRT